MDPFVRRSYLVVSPLNEDEVAASWTHNADAVILDLAGPVPDARKAEARASLAHAVPVAGKGAAEVFVRVNKDLLYADVKAAAVPGLRGIVLGGPGCASDVERADAILGEMEARKGIPEGHLQIVALLETARGVWNIREIIAGQARGCPAVGLDEPALGRGLGIAPCEEFDPFEYAKGRVVIETRAAKVQPVGVSQPLRPAAPFRRLGRDTPARSQGQEPGLRRYHLPAPFVGRAGQSRPDAYRRAAGVLPRDPPAVRRRHRQGHGGNTVPRLRHDDRRAGGRARPADAGAVGALRRPRRRKGGGGATGRWVGTHEKRPHAQLGGRSSTKPSGLITWDGN